MRQPRESRVAECDASCHRRDFFYLFKRAGFVLLAGKAHKKREGRSRMTTESGGKIPNIGVLIGVMRSRHRSEILHGIVEASKECNVNLFTFVSMQRRLGSKMNDSAVGETIYQLYTTYNYAQFANLDALIIADGALQNLGQDYAPDIRNFLSAFDHIPHFILGGEEENGNYIIRQPQGYRAS